MSEISVEPANLQDEFYKRQAAHMHDTLRNFIKVLSSELAGKRARILSNYNGQPYGRSKPALTGRVFTIKSAFLDYNGWCVTLDCDSDVPLWLHEVEIL